MLNLNIFLITSLVINIFCSSSVFAQGGERRQVFRFQGQYSVPLGDAEPLDFNDFPVGDVKVEIREGIPKIQYIFPDELDGIGTYLELRGTVDPDGSWVFFDAVGELRCIADGESVICKANYPGLGIDVSARNLILQARAESEIELKNRKQIAEIFDNEHIGFLELTPDVSRWIRQNSELNN